MHRRRIYLAGSGDDVRGEDSLKGPGAQPYAIRFHLHPDVRAELAQTGGSVLLRLCVDACIRGRRRNPGEACAPRVQWAGG